MADPVSLVVTPIIDNVIATAASLIKKEVGLVRDIKEHVEKLSSNLTSIQAVLKDAEERQLNEKPLKDWLGKLQSAAYDAQDILETFATDATLWKAKQQKRHHFSLGHTKTSYKSDAGHKINILSARLDVIAQEKEKFHLKIDDANCGKSQSHDYPLTGSLVNAGDVFGRDADKETIINQLLSPELDKEDDISVISIVGMAGLGKTTLAQFLFNDQKVINHFEFAMWVCVTADFNLSRILKEMIEYHSKMQYGTDLSPSQLQHRLLEFLVGKRFLLVLDDVWTENYDEWEPLQMLLKQGDKGSRVLVTSRSSNVSEIMGAQSPYLLDYLPENECWSLFEKIVFNHRNKSSSWVQKRKDLEVIGREIVGKCKGLPLAVKAMAGLLRVHHEVNKWQRILSSDIWELENESYNARTPKILPALKLSYNHLPSYLKHCFAYCSIFPKAYVFDKEEVVKHWIAESFILCRGENGEDEIGIEYFDELLVRSFFQISNIDNKVRYRMHDLTHDLAQWISSPYCCQVKDNKSQSSSQESRHVSLLCQDVEQPALRIVENSQKLRTLLFPTVTLKTFGQAIDKILQLKCLRKLDLSSSTILELPNSIKKLKLLRFLDLSGTEIKVLPNSICKLYNLQTLKLLGCLWLIELPKDLGNLVNLRYLELDDMFWFKCSTLPPRIGNLTSLQNLSSFQVGHKSGYRIEELKELACLKGTLRILKLENAVNATQAKLNEKRNLRKVVLEWSDRDVNVNPRAVSDEEKLLEDLQPHSNLKELQIINYLGINLPPWITDGHLQNLVSMSLNGCAKCRVLSLGELPHLGELYIKGMQDLEKILPNVQYRSLQRLKISNCPKLSELPELFLNLRVMKIKKCSSLKALPVTPSMMFLILVDNLVLENWHEATVQFISENEQGQHIVRRLPSFVNVLEMKVIDCSKLQALPRIFSPQKLEISGCELLNALPIQEHSRRLQHLALDTCNDGALVSTIPDTSSLYSLVISNISNLASFPRLPNLQGLKTLYISDCKDIVSMSEEGSLRSLTSLNLLSIRGCTKLVSLPDEGLPAALQCLIIGSCSSLRSLGTLKSLNSLQDLYIEDCPLLQSFPDDGLPAPLQHLLIQNCPSLIEQCRKNDREGPEWRKISHIPDLEIDFV